MCAETEMANALDKLLDNICTHHGPIKLARHFSLFKDQQISSDQWQSLQSVVPDSILKALPKRQASFFNGRVCAESVLTKLSVNSKVEIGNFQQPIWPNGVEGSISHCHGIALAVATKHLGIHGIGIDIEPVLDNTAHKAIRQSALNEEERNQLSQWSQTTGLPENSLVTIIFSLKESFYKSVFKYVNRILEFNAIEVIDMTERKVEFMIQDQSVIDNLTRQDVIQSARLHGQYVLHDKHAITCLVI